jgi:hypothetical protein
MFHRKQGVLTGTNMNLAETGGAVTFLSIVIAGYIPA